MNLVKAGDDGPPELPRPRPRPDGERTDRPRTKKTQTDRTRADTAQGDGLRGDGTQADRAQTDRAQTDRAQTDRVRGDRARGGGAAARARYVRFSGREIDLAVTAGFVLAAFAVLGRLWADPKHRYLVDGGQDQTQWEWFFAVTARAVTHLDDPFFTTLQNHPAGVNLMANTVMLGVSVPLAPVTLAFGPSITWALVLTLGLGGSAAAWYRLFQRHLGASRAAAAVGGGFCGFAPPIVSHANAHPNFVVLAAVPFMIGRLVRLARGEGRPVREGALLGLLAAYQVYLGEEVLLLTATGLAVFATAYAAARPAAAREAAGRLAAGIGVAAAVFLPLTTYALVRQFFGAQSYDGLAHGPSGNDAAVLAAFARQSLAGHQAVPGPLDAAATEQNAFFGWPLAVLVAALLVWLRRDPLVRSLGAVIVTAAVLSLGPEVVVDGRHTGMPGPWALVSAFPLFESVIESRLTLLCVPAAGLLLALGTDRFLATAPAGTPRASGTRALCCVVLAQALLPIAPKPLAAAERAPVPAFFTDGTWRRHVRPGRTLVPVPLPEVLDAEPLRWQMAAGLRFPVPEGYFVGPFGADRAGGYGAPRRPTSELLAKTRDEETPPVVRDADRAAARTDLAYWRADAVVLAPHPKQRVLGEALRELLGPGRYEDGVWVWDVRGLAGG
ncbi:glycosyl transferase [Actinomadura fibrosa]|uniref:Glycosyl transferase n=1 Tax=Actinomadura fibrosa TaxID=111802 RepID=A0ABW2XT41_9ACTN|nr:glycosyl transferase [Actinomadura fibrosa]